MAEAGERWQFNKKHREKHMGRFWRCPRRLLDDGVWRALWLSGCYGASSVLPVLAAHVWADASDAEQGWTQWFALSRHRIARLAGVTTDTATAALRELANKGILQKQNRPRRKREGGRLTYYRLSTLLFPPDRDGTEPHAEIPAALFYSGLWPVLPTDAARHLYLVIACLDPVGDEEAYLARIEEDFAGETWEEIHHRLAEEEGREEHDLSPADFMAYTDPAGERLDRELEAYEAYNRHLQREVLSWRRERAAVSLADLAALSGLDRRTVSRTLPILTAPIFGGRMGDRLVAPLPMILSGREETGPRRPTWYAPNRDLLPDRDGRGGWTFLPEWLNDRDRLLEIRRSRWPGLYPSRTAETLRRAG